MEFAAKTEWMKYIKFRYLTTIALLFMILAFSRGFVLPHYTELSLFSVLHALAEGGGGDGDGISLPNITLTMLPHMSVQPLASLYLSQIPYIGLDLSPAGTVLYWIVLVGLALVLAYIILFGAVPMVNRRMRNFGSRIQTVLNTREIVPVAAPVVNAVSAPAHTPHIPPAPPAEPPRNYSSYEGFKSYARNGALSIEDVVKGLSRHPHVEPIYEKVEPVYENVESIEVETVIETGSMQPHIHGFAVALIEGDRVAVFAELRQYVQGGGVPEHLLSKTVCLIDDVYRSRIDGTACDQEMVRLTARLDTPTLEKVVSALATYIDSSYSIDITGAKLALTRALAVLGA